MLSWDCFAEPVFGRRLAPIRWLAMTEEPFNCLAISAAPTPSPSSFWSLCMATVTRSKRPVNSKVGATVGAFYSRFESKEAYFNALIEVAARDGETRLSQMVRDQQLPDASLGKLCRLLVHGIIGWIRNHEGVLRAALQHDDTRPNKWTTFKGLARATTAHATPPLLQILGKGRKAAKTRSIAFGFQMVLGTLVNAILNDPGPLSIHDDEMEVRLSNCLLLLLQAEMKTPSPKASVSMGRRKK
jgi:AcrR family transcriptional regulator